jgi:hypothetical protein
MCASNSAKMQPGWFSLLLLFALVAATSWTAFAKQAMKQLKEPELIKFVEKLRESEGGRLNEGEIVKFLEKLRTAPAERFKPPEGPFDEGEAYKARERLAEEEERIKQTEQRAAEALAKWNALSDAQKEAVFKAATERAKQQQKKIINDLELSEKLLQKEAADLEDSLDRDLKREEEENERKSKEEQLKDEQEFEAKRAVYRERKLKERTTLRSVGFWIVTFIFSLVLSTLGMRKSA